MRFYTTLGRMATEYGVPLEDALEGCEDDLVAVYRDDEGWHVAHLNGCDLLDEEWAPRDDEQAERLCASTRRGALCGLINALNR